MLGFTRHARQRVAVALTTREHADRLVDIVSRKQKAPQQAPQLAVARAGYEVRQVIDDTRLRVEHFVLILREVVDLDLVSRGLRARRQGLLTGKHLDQRRFSRAVLAHERDPVARAQS